MGTCHICGRNVPMSDDKGPLLAIIHDAKEIAYTTKPQHILPSATCAGSPSIAQYITGEADLRADDMGNLLYPVHPDLVDTVKKAYMQLLVLAGLHRGTPPLNKKGD